MATAALLLSGLTLVAFLRERPPAPTLSASGSDGLSKPREPACATTLGSKEDVTLGGGAPAAGINLSIDVPKLWPPKRQMVRVARGVSAADACGDASLTIEVTSNEPPNGAEDADAEPDWEVVNNGDGSFDIWLRAEHAEHGKGRVYTVTATATDCAGNTSQSIATVSVPRDPGGGKGAALPAGDPRLRPVRA
jgi:hypothetical protein